MRKNKLLWTIPATLVISSLCTVAAQSGNNICHIQRCVTKLFIASIAIAVRRF